MISTDNISDMIKQIQKYTDQSEHTKSLLACYHFRDNQVGLPIDSIICGDYSRYVDAFKYLLYQKDEALYAGMPIYESEREQRYVPGLATLMLLAIIGRLEVLSGFKEKIIIPESYISFFQEEYSKASEMNQVSSSSLHFVDDKPIIQEIDKSIPDIWDTILDFCRSCATMKINDQERIDFRITDGLSGEQFVTGLRLSMIHLDALLLAQREKATFLCDDSFFRKVATWSGIRNVNIVSLLQHYIDPNFVVPIIKDLSNTNYIFVPLLARNDDEYNEIVDNLLNGEKKELIYSYLFNQMIKMQDRWLRDNYGDEFVNRLYCEHEDETSISSEADGT